MTERTDRELLELAAKAAGIELMFGDNAEPARWHDNTAGIGGWWTAWSPLTDDGDALRLAVKLAINMRPKDDAMTVWAPKSARSFHEYATENGDDMNAATRRAIVLAAAEIGAKP